MNLTVIRNYNTQTSCLGVVSDVSPSNLPTVCAKIPTHMSGRCEGVDIDPNMLVGRIPPEVDTGIKLHRNQLILRGRLQGGRVVKALKAARRIEGDVDAGGREEEREAIAKASVVKGVDGEGEGGGEIRRLSGGRIVHLYGFAEHGSPYTAQVVDPIELDGAVVNGGITFIDDAAACVRIEGGDVEEHRI